MKSGILGFVVIMACLAFPAIGNARSPLDDEKSLVEIPVDIRGESLAIPSNYGRLVNVVVNAEVHYLYFQDSKGDIRIVLLGTGSAMQRARHGLQLLSPNVYTIERHKDPISE